MCNTWYKTHKRRLMKQINRVKPQWKKVDHVPTLYFSTVIAIRYWLFRNDCFWTPRIVHHNHIACCVCYTRYDIRCMCLVVAICALAAWLCPSNETCWEKVVLSKRAPRRCLEDWWRSDERGKRRRGWCEGRKCRGRCEEGGRVCVLQKSEGRKI